MLQQEKRNIFDQISAADDLKKQQEQLGEDCLEHFDFFFSENGLAAYKQGALIKKTSFLEHLGNDRIKTLINFILKYIADLDIPVKRGTFVEFRNGMLNVSPIGRNCSQAERDAFEQFDDKAGVRKKMVSAMEKEFADLGLTFSIGGQISFRIRVRLW